MSVEKFLHFWSHNTALIIEGLLAAVILLSLFLAYRLFSRKKEVYSASVEGVDASQLEKTLQKILENQVSHQALNSPKAQAEDAEPSEKPSEGEDAVDVNNASPDQKAEVADLKKSLADSKKEVAALQTKVSEQASAVKAAEELAKKNATVSAEGLPTAAAGPQASELMDKIRDLEARLAEYEIISEDIADLSKYREENDVLKKEIESLKVTGSTASPPTAIEEAAPAVSMEPQQAVVASEEPVVAPVEAAVQSADADGSLSDPPQANVPTAAAGSDVIDDELMKEFAAAVEGQKAKALSTAAEKAGDGKAPAAAAPEDANALMNDFENFVTKKS